LFFVRFSFLLVTTIRIIGIIPSCTTRHLKHPLPNIKIMHSCLLFSVVCLLRPDFVIKNLILHVHLILPYWYLWINNRGVVHEGIIPIIRIVVTKRKENRTKNKRRMFYVSMHVFSIYMYIHLAGDRSIVRWSITPKVH
jgi:hypothetical protein